MIRNQVRYLGERFTVAGDQTMITDFESTRRT